MFDHLTERLARAIKTLRGEARLTESNVQEALREVRVALLEADVALPVVKKFIDGVRGKALGEEVVGSLTPGQAAVGVVYRELVALMGERNDALNLATQPPAVILLAGLQGSGKTTTAAKLARWLKNELRKKVVLASCDVYRPAAIEQLKTLAAQVGAEFFPSAAGEKPVDIAERALGYSRTHYNDVLIVDSAGRLAIDEAMMREIAELNAVLKPIETLYVVDAMQGQDAVNTARAFADALPLTGIILTKLDGDARGGAALSVREVTGRPIKFAGVGEKLDALEPFHPDRMASRILGMGDVLSLIEDVTKSVDRAQVEKLAQKVKSGKDFDLEDFKQQVAQMKKMGGLAALADKLPGNLAQLAQGAPGMDDKAIRRLEGIINSMTREERARPDLIKASRKRRIAAGAGVTVQEVNRLLNQFEQAQKMMKMMSSKGGIAQMMRSMKGMFPGMR
ncbi:MAG TPA: signal recognition particle protein [Burkholderiales bacterium]|nr:signal recognition particle protein [Burkholderiales bacterium]